MSEEMRKQIDKIKNFSEFLSDNVDKSKYVEYISQKNNKDYSEVEKVFNDVEFITLYRSEGTVVDKEKLPISVRDNSGRWFTPNYHEMVRYNNMNKNREIYKIDVPLDFYNAMRTAFGTASETSKGEVKLPIELSLLKVKM